ncbi:hypothetical protein DIU31_031865 [Mucilaginibacter rubeus]|uniref:Uncharacterized protein n=1 Tax=Mucilaginibacter rubeus TaxID=2027860 RepID=A0AAE6MLH5_9SPHI|nr:MULTISPECIES: hypothetical protein [Mucilaginibacter]QEM07878.1 hypothetical protein DIU31_031865 [Mucilaginibacter rubeus]QEM20330.1 hypothetical protein DIU38_031470 [Mucilaginibacter gossypii]QTE42951.1 hypothetical protein J3L19_29190 [Mucilaginibacter rubeus]QTE49552.1 hypothetical protein J3L21_29150 [Mucilaginibacter rubeus]QTE54648.1 hypothetical protein J3L23_20775 [Mucilaginibacter rubeus]
MAKKKNKHKIQEDPRKLQARHKRDYLSRLKMVCDKLVGPGWFELIPAVDMDIIYEKRYPSLTIKMAPGTVIDEVRWQTYRQTLSALLDAPAFEVTEHNIPLKTILSEGLALIHFVSMMAENRFPRSEELRAIFKPFLITTDGYYGYIADQVAFLLFLMDVRNGNFRDGFLHADRTQTNIGIVRATANTIFIHLFKPITGSIVINDRKREIIAVNRFVPRGISLQVKFHPSAIGLQAVVDDPLPVYIQRHALNRLDERLGLQANNVHSHLFFSLYEQPVNYVPGNGCTLIEFNMYEYKVGYLLTTLHEDKLIIRSFLFLTNDGTPEGRKLRQLTGLIKHDKKYLGIDKLSTFTAYKIHEDEELSTLFHDAGCGSLLDAKNLQAIAAEYTPDRNKSTLHKYMNLDN